MLPQKRLVGVLWFTSGLGFWWVLWVLLQHIMYGCIGRRRWNCCLFYGITQQGANEGWNKNSRPTHCTDRKQIFFQLHRWEMWFAVILTSHWARKAPQVLQMENQGIHYASLDHLAPPPLPQVADGLIFHKTDQTRSGGEKVSEKIREWKASAWKGMRHTQTEWRVNSEGQSGIY